MLIKFFFVLLSVVIKKLKGLYLKIIAFSSTKYYNRDNGIY